MIDSSSLVQSNGREDFECPQYVSEVMDMPVITVVSVR